VQQPSWRFARHRDRDLELEVGSYFAGSSRQRREHPTASGGGELGREAVASAGVDAAVVVSPRSAGRTGRHETPLANRTHTSGRLTRVGIVRQSAAPGSWSDTYRRLARIGGLTTGLCAVPRVAEVRPLDPHRLRYPVLPSLSGGKRGLPVIGPCSFFCVGRDLDVPITVGLVRDVLVR
jgi:hypothetical protein